jgi:hypothetical protein
MKTNEKTHQATTIRVAAPVIDADIPVCSEVLNALADPADPDQAVLINVPMLVDGLNYGDLVRLAPEDDFGVRRVTEVVIASGHAHLLAAVDQEDDPRDLVAELERRFPSYGLRVEAARGSIVAISVHPNLNPEEVIRVVGNWLGAEDGESLPIGEPVKTAIGPLAWA